MLEAYTGLIIADQKDYINWKFLIHGIPADK